MERITLKEAVTFSGGKLISASLDSAVLNISTDTRSLSAGDLFVAIKGGSFNGHDFVKEALAKGASGVVVSEDGFEGLIANVIKVADTLEALKGLARNYVKKFPKLKVVGITGSNGKTTTKDMAAHILSGKFKVLKPEGSFNNAIGLPLTCFKLDSSHDAAVLEYGTNHRGEINYLAGIVSPDIAVMTNIGRTHLEHFPGGMDEIFEEKFDLVRNLKDDGTAVINADDLFLKKVSEAACLMKVATFGLDNPSDVRASGIRELGEGGFSFIISAGNEKAEIRLSVLGRHNIYNALAAAAAGFVLGLDLKVIKERLESWQPVSFHRLARFNAGGVLIIDDAYNANPDSVRGALEAIKGLKGGRKLAVLGDMAELGTEGGKLHLETGRLAAKSGLDFLVTVGDLSSGINEGALESGMPKKKLLHFKDRTEAAKAVLKLVKPGDVVLVKGSRRMKLEEVVEMIKGIKR